MVVFGDEDLSRIILVMSSLSDDLKNAFMRTLCKEYPVPDYRKINLKAFVDEY